jgi:O-methyltransferase
MCYLYRKRDVDFKVDGSKDYVRISSLELCAYEIKRKNVAGAVAELGVYKGDFAQHLNKYFPASKLYLFDTFEGFSDEDVQYDKTYNFSSVDTIQDFSDTGVELVLSKMKHRNNCIIVKGMFPESLQGLEDSFIFVSLDADLYKPIYDGLQYFYPRLKQGGYIFIHDFNNEHYKGAKEAVINFCSEQSINFFPLTDVAGTAVISK